MAEQEDTRSISDILKAAGFGHRPSPIAGKREVYNLETGAVLGCFDAGAALVAIGYREA